ncbi:uncharacterized protein PGTG_11526 [Puccinia graminis f. sp. tritici CRL 75-36-700-3]|uniref:Uncharacterized protein n=1 Tax=Puccinia graminis f. sp. tritici (strain CRL 75-36-700-3 / race SCCL) TaxID=418459 RepID=E3KM08_PUCGT|nr:uncharacterized protein PGTG_11526 [Puccinia graminis f. sp. tritici CRL 75-36-700-3]EFP85357.2 hypothetical protein PGTG_11526 [Puccinia graminis f. sp. tritici CRL 75-36-700-3]
MVTVFSTPNKENFVFDSYLLARRHDTSEEHLGAFFIADLVIGKDFATLSHLRLYLQDLLSTWLLADCTVNDNCETSRDESQQYATEDDGKLHFKSIFDGERFQ